MQLEKVVIGVPREIMPGENRVSAIPETVEKMITAGAEVLIEAGAGAGAFIDDAEYQAKGAEIIEDLQKLYSRANVILKVKEPRQHEKYGKHETELFSENSSVSCFPYCSCWRGSFTLSMTLALL